MPAASPAGQKCFGEKGSKSTKFVPEGADIKDLDAKEAREKI